MFKEKVTITIESHELRSGETIITVLKRKIKNKIKKNDFKILHALKAQNPLDTNYYCIISYEK